MEQTEPAILQVDGWTFAYPGRPLLQGWSARIKPGVSLVLGGDGAGKTTLLRLLAGALPAQSGSALLMGQPLQASDATRSSRVYWMEPRSAGLDALSPAQWFEQLPQRYPQWNAGALQQHVQGFGLPPHLHKPMFQLSTGTQRKVLLAAGLASGAELTLFDEPIAGLDKPSILYLQQALTHQALQPQRAIVVAHYEPLPGVPWRDTWVLPD